MSQEKAQLIAPLGNITFSGVTATGVITATSLEGNISGAASSIKQGTSVTAGVVTASSFAGNLTGNIQRLADSGPNISVGVVTATSFSGNLTGSVTDLTSQPAITVGVVTATRFSGPVTGDIRGNVTGNVSGVATGNVTGNVDGNITGNVTGTIAGNVTGNVTGNASGHASGLGINYNGGWAGAGTSQISVGVITATSFYGDGSTLDGVAGGPVSAQSVTIDGASTSIDLSSGNLIYASQSANTTVSFANSENGNVYFVRVKDATDTARTITWPDRINWEGGTTPTLLNSNDTQEAQIFLLVTRDSGVTWYGKEIYKNIGAGFDLFGWGYDGNGASGRNSTSPGDTSSPIQIGASGSGWGHVYMGLDGALMNFYGKLDGSLWSAGYNNRGNLGLNDIEKRSSPTQIGTDTTWSRSGLISRHSPKVLKTDGTLWTWGGNGQGNLGLNQTSNFKLSSPTQIPGTTWSAAAGVGSRTLALKTDGSLWSWGYNEYGQCGQNDTIKKSSPTQVGTDTTWAKLPVNAGEGARAAGAAIKTNGTLWMWGSNYFAGKLGLNTRTDVYSSPIQIGTDTTWANVATGDKVSMATKTDGTLWMMGDNERGALGQNNLIYYSSPVQVPGTNWHLTHFRHIANSEGTMAMKQDGTLWSWGNSGSGRNGLNDNTERSSPAQVAGTWEAIGGGSAISGLKA